MTPEEFENHKEIKRAIDQTLGTNRKARPELFGGLQMGRVDDQINNRPVALLVCRVPESMGLNFAPQPIVTAALKSGVEIFAGFNYSLGTVVMCQVKDLPRVTQEIISSMNQTEEEFGSDKDPNS